MNTLKRALIALLFLSLLGSCKSQFDLLLHSTDVDEVYKGAHQYFDRGKYLRAADLFDRLLLSVKGTEKDDSVQFYLGLSNYRYGDYQIAEANFDQFVTLFPRSPFTEEAKYLRLECLYKSTHRWELDQVPSYRALSAIDLFKYEYPQSEYLLRVEEMVEDLKERLDRKALEAAKLYYTIEDYKAAAHALKNVLKENAENQFREEVLYYIVLANYKYASNSVREKQRERYLVLIDEYYNYISEYPDSNRRRELDKIFEQAQRVIKK